MCRSQNVSHSGLASLLNDVRSEIDLVMWRPDARSHLHYKICRVASEFVAHGRDGFRHNTKLGAFLPGVHESDRPDFLVGQIDGGAIGDVYCQA